MKDNGGYMSNERVRQQNIEKVLCQAQKLFIANGIENTSMGMIARESDLTLRSVQNYFHTRNDLYVAVLNREYAFQLENLHAFFESEQYKGRNGAEQVLDIISMVLNRAVENCETVFCTSQMQHIVSRASEDVKLNEKCQYIMDQTQKAFDKGTEDGSIARTISTELIDVSSIMLVLRGVREQIAYAMCNRSLREVFDPETAIRKYIRQMELIFKAE
jgi:AcrR family transcriptional regulator